jgi:hypothetical protein
MAKRLGIWSIGAVLMGLLTVEPAWAQATAALNGRVVDQGGAVLPGVAVTATNTETGAARDTVTNVEGLYSLPALVPGIYKLTTQLTGFSAPERDNIELITGSNLTIDVQMTVAALAETLTVVGQAPFVEATQAAFSSSIRQTEVVQLPMLNRSMGALMTLLPGAREVTGAISAHGTSSNFVSLGGGGGQNYNMLVDGIDNKEDHCGGTEIVYSLEGIQEFKVLTTGYQAEYGKGTATVLMATKSGTNSLHGTGFVYGRNESLITTDYFSKPENGGLGKPPFSRLQFGGSAGGPIVKDRAWFFGSLERVQQDFSVVRSATQYAESQYIAALVPDVVNTYSIPQPSRDLLTQFKVNFNVNRNHNFYARYSGEVGYVDNDAMGASSVLLSWAQPMDRNKQNLWNAAGGWTWIVSPTTVNQVNFQFITFTHDNQYPACPLPTTNLGVYLGVNNCLPERLVFPSVSTAVANAFPHWYNFEDKYEFKDDFSKEFGRHATKYGADYTWMPTFGGIFGGGSPGSINFFDDPSTIAKNTNGKYPLGFGTPGAVRSISETTSVAGDYSSVNNWGISFYGQDDFRASSRLTLNMGLRYDYYSFLNSQANLATNRTYQVLKAIGNPWASGLPAPEKNNFSPRVGMAWDLHGDGKDVVRASYGLFYMQILKNSTYQREFLQKDVLYITQTTTNSAVGVGPLANYVYGVTPLPAIPVAPTTFPAGGNSVGYWYDPDIKDARTQQGHVGWSHLLGSSSVFSADYTHTLMQNGWRSLDINPLLPDPANPAGARVRPLAADFQRVYGDPRIMGIVNILVSNGRSLYDEIATHYEHRFTTHAGFQVNYTLAWGRGIGGVADGTTRTAPPSPQVASASGGLYDAPWEWGPTAFDERHRLTVAGNLEVPFGIEVSPSITAASARPYTQYRATNPSGDGSLQLLCPSGNSNDVGFGVGQVPCGVNNARGYPLFNANVRVTKTIPLGANKLGLFAELYNVTNRANFGNVIGGNQFAPTTYNQPVGYLGGIGAVSTIPNSFQVQFGARYSF